MAATVTGTFRILDRASRPMEGMRREAERLDKALVSVGDQMDEIGTSKQLHQLDATEKKLRDLDRTAERFGGGPSSALGRTRREARQLGDDTDRLSYRLGRLAAAFSGVQKILGLMKIPLIITGVVALTQAVGALMGGLVALTPMLADTLGIFGAMPAAITGVALAMTTVKVAFGGMDRALKGTKGAMAELTPEARTFVRELKALKPIGKELRESAQAGLLPGLSQALGSLTSNRAIGTAKRMLGGMGQTLGATAAQAAQAFTRPGFLRDFEALGRQGEGLMSRLGSALINVSHALVDVAIAAEPFTSWLAETIQGWTVGAREAAQLGRQTGTLESYFDRTRGALERFGSIAGNIWDTFKGLGRAARPLGEDLWESADRATERWARFTNSLRGQYDLRRYFEGLREPIGAMFDLVGALASAVMDLGDSPGLTRTMEALTRAVGPLEKAFEEIGTHLGPAFAKTVEQLIRLFANLSEQAGVFGKVVELLNMFLEGINGLLETVPGLTNLFTAVLGAVALQSLAGRLRGLAASWGLVATEAGAAAAAQRAAGMAGIGAVGGRRSGVPGSTGPIVVGGASRRAPLIGPQGRLYNTRPNTTFIAPASGAAEAVPSTGSRLVQGAGLGAAAMMGLRGAGRFFAPIAGFMAATDFLTTQGDVGERFQGALSGATLGILPGPTPDAERREQATLEEQETISRILGERPKGRGGIMAARNQLRRRRRNLAGDQLGLRERADGDAGAIKQMRSEGLDFYNDIGDTARQKELGVGIQGLNQELAAQARLMGGKAAQEFSGAWAIYAKSGGNRKAMEELLTPVTKRLNIFVRQDAPQAARALGSSMLAAAAEAKRHNPKLIDEYDRLENRVEAAFKRMGMHVEVVNGRIYTGSKSEWEKIQNALGNQAERAQQRVSTAFTAMQQEAIGSLVAMGYDRATAVKIVQGMERGDKGAARAAGADPISGQVGPGKLDPHYRGGPKGARGMRIPGVGRHDTVPLTLGMAAPGELIVNQHTERDVDRDLSLAGRPTLGERVMGESRKHSDPAEHVFHTYGGRRFAKGGRAAYPDAMGALPGLDALAHVLNQKFGLRVVSGLRPGAITTSGNPSDHGWGGAIDVSNGVTTPQMDAAHAWLESVLGPALKQMLYRTMVGGNHFDHIHVALNEAYARNPELLMRQIMGGGAMLGGMGGGMGMGVGRLKLKGHSSGMGGAAGAMADAAMKALQGGMEGAINKQLGGATGAAGAVNLKGGLDAWLTQALKITGHFTPGNLTALRGRAMQESGGDPRAINNWDSNAAAGTPSKGLLQTIDPTFDAYKMPGMGNIWNPVHNAVAAIRYMFDRYGHIVGPSSTGYSQGGRIPEFAGWFGTEGTITAHGPTILGIGDGGTETATVTRGTPNAGRSISVKIEKIENHRDGDIKDQIKREVGQAFRELHDELGVDFDADEVLV